MVNYISFVLIAMASVAIAESRVIPTEPISVTLDTYGNPVMFLREKRTAVRPYPHRTMMFTGYYRPIRRTNNSGQATGVFAQGNAVSGEAFFGGMHTPHLKGGPEPTEESEVSSAEAQAAPAPEEQEREYHHHRNEVHRHEEEYHEHDEEEQLHPDDPHYHYHHQDSLTPQGHHELEQIPLTTEIAQPTEKPFTTEASRPKMHHTKKTHKTPVTINADDDDDEDEVDEEDDEPVVPFVPFKGNRRRQKYPHLNNFFPMVFSFPRLATRAGSSGSVPGAITAIANSYSTGKGGVASSVATAYGGSPTGMSRILLFVALLVAVAVALPAPQFQGKDKNGVHESVAANQILTYYYFIDFNITSRNFFNLTDETIPVNTPKQLKELIAAYEENFGKLINFAIKISDNKDNNKREIQFLKHKFLSSIIGQLVQEQSRVMHAKLNNTDSILQTLNKVNNVKDLINTIKEIDIVYQDEEITDEHVRIKRAATLTTSEERMTNMLIDIQRQVVQIRKYLDKLCKKHHPTSTTILEVNSDVDISPVGQPNKVAIM
ncbi:hypothetical protein ALC57_06444 [Trachymyrmex cornetzi]|uniref:Uncharacterized protein n=1 Tax=Trachymyrmex cornetzi TaxID=471704 RepID=A0A151J8R0_9HYME|nr:hypothetical protein ALC57_06444 [Trachymyrmex cornetzi]